MAPTPLLLESRLLVEVDRLDAMPPAGRRQCLEARRLRQSPLCHQHHPGGARATIAAVQLIRRGVDRTAVPQRWWVGDVQVPITRENADAPEAFYLCHDLVPRWLRKSL